MSVLFGLPCVRFSERVLSSGYILELMWWNKKKKILCKILCITQDKFYHLVSLLKEEASVVKPVKIRIHLEI